jgi:hypothetical protein
MSCATNSKRLSKRFGIVVTLGSLLGGILLPRVQQWYELKSITTSISSSADSDALSWQYESNAEYVSSSLYDVLNFGGVAHPCLSLMIGNSLFLLECTFSSFVSEHFDG